MTWQTLGFDFIKRHFEKVITGGQLNHAYLFTGQDMIGKRTFALELARSITGVNDIFVAESGSIDESRQIKNFLSLTAFGGERKIVIINNAHEMTDEAQNALLKILEEPSPTSMLILVSHAPSRLHDTIRSRVQEVQFPVHGKNIIVEYLKNKNLSHDQEDFLYTFSNGSIGLLAQMGDFKQIKQIAEEYTALARADLNKRFEIAKQLAVDEQLRQKVLFWMLYLRTKKLYQPLRGLLALYDTISHTQYNQLLALENFMLQL